MAHSDDIRSLAAHLDRQNRFMSAVRGVQDRVMEVGGAWIAHDPTSLSEFPSANSNRVYWLTVPGAVRAAQVREVFEAIGRLNVPRMFAWLSPHAWDAQTHAALEALGALTFPHVRYIALTRSMLAGAAPASTLTTRVIGRGELEAVLTGIAPWYKERGVAALRRLTEFDAFELHAAFDGPAVIAIAAIVLDGEWAHFGWAGTDPAHQRRGGQTALIHARIRSAREHAAVRCAVETNTVGATSLANLKRCGFAETMEFKVYGWGPAANAGKTH